VLQNRLAVLAALAALLAAALTGLLLLLAGLLRLPTLLLAALTGLLLLLTGLLLAALLVLLVRIVHELSPTEFPSQVTTVNMSFRSGFTREVANPLHGRRTAFALT
jgi:hypothetical protein